MKQQVIKILKKAGLVLAGIILLLAVTIGIVFQFVLTPEKITPRIVSALNENLNARLSLDAVELTFFKTFPSFKLELTEGAIVNPMDSITGPSAKRAQDTLIAFESAVVSVNPIAFLRNKIKVNRFTFVNPKIYAFVTPEGEVNWNILKETDDSKADIDAVSTSSDEEFKASIDLEDISIVNGKLIFDDRYTENYFATRGFDMDLEAEYNEKEILLDLNMDSEDIVFRNKEGSFSDNLTIDLVADFRVDRTSRVIAIQEAQVALNELVFDASGNLRPDAAEKEIDVDLELELKVPTLNTLIDLIPEALFDKTEKYKASGQALISAKIEGIYKKGMIPGVQANLLVKDGSLSYNNKPNQIELIEINTDLSVPPDKGKQSAFNINQMRLKGVGTDLSISGSGTDIFDAGSFDLKFDGTLDLGALEKTLPFKKDIGLKGNMEMSLRADFDKSDIENQDYGRIQALGKLKMKQVLFDNKTDSLHFELSELQVVAGQDQNSDLLGTVKTKVIGGEIQVNGFNFRHGNASEGFLDQFSAHFASTPLKDTSQVATLKAAILIDEGQLSLGDSLKARVKYLKGDLMFSPKPGQPKTPQIASNFQVDSSGALMKGKRVSLIQARYKIKTTKVGNNWPLDGDISFGTLYAYTPRFPLEVQIPKTEIVLRPGLIELDHAKLIIGRSDLTATGRVYNIGEAFFEDKIFRGELEIASDMIDVNQMIQALNDGAAYAQNEAAGATKEDQAPPPSGSEDPGTEPATEPRSFVVPGNMDLRLQSRFKKVLYKRFEIDQVVGLITVKDQKIDLANLQMKTMAANMSTSVAYTSKEKGKAALGFDFKLYDIDLAKLTELFPVIDSLLPMAESFEGKVNFRMKGNSAIDKSLGMVGPSLDAIARIEGDDLVILDGKTFQKIAKMLFFKNKERNTIDKLEFAMIFKNATIEVFPSVITVDRYRVAIGGQHKMDMTYDYHISILKSPMPFKAGIDIKGTDDDLDFKITKAKYKRLFSTKERQRQKADSTLIKRKISVINRLPFYQ
jgi:uncharacterized protein involved in outer membrane biogenesis